MNKRRYSRAGLALILALLLLPVACVFAAGPNPAAAVGAANPVVLSASIPSGLPSGNAVSISDEAGLSDAALPETVIEVSTVDELLNAIGPDRVICLADGEYNLTKARSYGQSVNSSCWYWEGGYEGYQLRIFGVSNLYLLGSGSARCSIVTEPRYSNVLCFADCDSLGLRGLSVGHTPEQGYCSGGVLDLAGCMDVIIDACDLYGCGTVGISATNCRGLTAVGTVIHDCTYGALEAYSCRNFRFLGGSIINCGISKDPENSDGWTGFELIHADNCSFVAIVNTVITGNVVQTLFSSSASVGFHVLGCEICDNTVGLFEEGRDDAGGYYSYSYGSVFSVRGAEIWYGGNSFFGNRVKADFIYAEGASAAAPVVSLDGIVLDRPAIEAMQREAYPTDRLDELDPSFPDTGADAFFGSPDAAPAVFNEIHVTTADEFLAAISDYTVIHLDTDLLDLSTASDYGGFGGSRYYWADNYDGPGLVISGVSGLSIVGQGKDRTVIQAVPRYSDVLYFDSCHDVSISDLTAGHEKQEPGSCSGDVLEFLSCDQVTVANCGLFGCGVNGIVADSCSDFAVFNTEIYDCSWHGAQLYSCSDFRFERCSIHDCASNDIYLSDCRDTLWNGANLYNGSNPV
ncbi:MAG: right-handed parallel beta-helix repeat-containing protein [Oscillospiraceae bacterium]|nr:right-handed parallel beta-helix repeat-containing protein [Oscillospiraceae bacterium]